MEKQEYQNGYWIDPNETRFEQLTKYRKAKSELIRFFETQCPDLMFKILTIPQKERMVIDTPLHKWIRSGFRGSTVDTWALHSPDPNWVSDHYVNTPNIFVFEVYVTVNGNARTMRFREFIGDIENKITGIIEFEKILKNDIMIFRDKSRKTASDQNTTEKPNDNTPITTTEEFESN